MIKRRAMALTKTKYKNIPQEKRGPTTDRQHLRGDSNTLLFQAPMPCHFYHG